MRGRVGGRISIGQDAQKTGMKRLFGGHKRLAGFRAWRGQILRRVLPPRLPVCLEQTVDAIRRHNIRNYSIFRDGNRLFAYFEYVGDDYEADMAGIAADPVTQEWWALTGPMQDPDADREAGAWWKTIPEVFHTD